MKTTVLAAFLVTAASTSALAAPKEASFHAVAVNMSNVGQRGMGTLDIGIERWTTDEEFAALRDALTEKGSDALMSALQKTPRAGFIRRTGGGLGWEIHFARREDLPGGGSRVIVATDRPMSFWERANNPRSADYEFLVAELRVDKDGQGQGKLIPMAKVTFDDQSREVEIENYASEPIRLTRVTSGR